MIKTPKGIFVGTFTEQDLKNGIDKKQLAEMKAKTGLNYVNTRMGKHKGEAVLKLWVCNAEDMDLAF